MKILKLAATFAVCALALPAFASVDFSEKTSVSAKDETGVGAALQKVDYIANGKADANAEFYILLYSASWCGPCQREMPHIAELYKDKISKDKRVELVHISCDRDVASAKAWAKQMKVKFPVVSPKNKAPIPGSQSPRGIPNMRLVDASGKLIFEGHGSNVLKYESLLLKQ